MSSSSFDGNAVVFCDGAFNTPNGKTAHGLVRFTGRYHVVAVIDGNWAGRDAGEVLDGQAKGIPVVASLEEARAHGEASGHPATHFVIGLAPDGGRLPATARSTVIAALRAGLHVDAGLHDFLSEDPEFAELALEKGVVIRDVRRPPDRRHLHFFSGAIETVGSTRVAVLGTDSAVGKRTTAWMLVHGLEARGRSAEMIGTGQTAWMQGVRYGCVLDSVVSDFVTGEIEHAIWRAWTDVAPEFMVLEGQGSLLNPAYPGGFELLAAGRPHTVVLQHAPTRRSYDGFPDYPLHHLADQIRAVELISGVAVAAITLNHEGLAPGEVDGVCAALERETGLPCVDPLLHGVDRVVDLCVELATRRREAS